MGKDFWDDVYSGWDHGGKYDCDGDGHYSFE